MEKRNHEGIGRYSGTTTKVDSLMDELFDELKKYNGGGESTAALPSVEPTPPTAKMKEATPISALAPDLGVSTDPDQATFAAEASAVVDEEDAINTIMASSWDVDSLAETLATLGLTAEEALNIYPIGEEGPDELVNALRELSGLGTEDEEGDMTPPVGLDNYRGMSRSGFIPD